MGKRKRRARAMNRESVAVADSDRTQRNAETKPPGGAQPRSGRWRSQLKTIGVVGLIAVALAVLIVGQIKPSSGSLTASARPAGWPGGSIRRVLRRRSIAARTPGTTKMTSCSR